MGGQPFGKDLDAPSADALLVTRMHSILDEASGGPPLTPASGPQITEVMQAVRNLDLKQRKELYERDRLRHQQDWYATKALANRQSANRWTAGQVALVVAGVLAGLGKALGLLELDGLGVAAASVGAVVAWVQTKQYRLLERSYGITSHELAEAISRVRHIESEIDWATFVSDVEEAISREHTLWSAARVDRDLNIVMT